MYAWDLGGGGQLGNNDDEEQLVPQQVEVGHFGAPSHLAIRGTVIFAHFQGWQPPASRAPWKDALFPSCSDHERARVHGGAEAIEKGHELRLSQPLTEMHLAQTQFSVNSGLGFGIR